MKKWNITYNNNSCQPEIISANTKQDTPKLICSLNGVRFYVEFANQTDHYASSCGHLVEVEVISWQRSKRFKGTAACEKLSV